MAEKQWHLFEEGACPQCQGDMEAFTDCEEKGPDGEQWFSEDDPARCVKQCGYTAIVYTDGSGNAWLAQADEIEE